MDAEALLSERVERAAMEEIHRAAPDDLRSELGLRLDRIGTSLASISEGDPSTLLNRAIGLGVDAAASGETVEALVTHYREHGIGRFYLHLHPQAHPTELRDWILAAGLERGRAWMKFRRGRGEPPPARTDLEIRRVDASNAGDWGRIVASAFEMSPTSARLLAALSASPAWHLYLALDGDRPVASASLFVYEGAGWLDWAATLPEARGRGAQSGLLRRRIHDALELGCRVLFTETGEAEGKDPQHSYRNILRAGFETAHLRENFVPAGNRT